MIRRFRGNISAGSSGQGDLADPVPSSSFLGRLRLPLGPFAVLPLLAALAACNSGGGGGGGGVSEYDYVDADCTWSFCPAPGPGTESNPYDLIHVDVAHNNGWTGDGQLVAMVDDGIRSSHQEFNGKSIDTFGVVPQADHGTHVASLIAAVINNAGMEGVAPDADLHVTSWAPLGGSTFAIANVTSGTLDAANLGAVAQNNSWGFDVSAQELADYLALHAGDVAGGLDDALGYGKSNWQAYLNALNAFQANGVIVWALSNDDTMSTGDILATLPYFEPTLGEAWIAAVNGYFEVDGSGEITRAVRLSAPCGYAATFCLAGDGTTVGADATSDTSYSAGTGTSYVAPQITGAVALLAEAFPSLTPAEWAERLFATANDAWFAPGDVAGTTDFGGGVTHDYSTEWGYGTIDLEAALAPIGGLSVMSHGDVETAERTPLARSGIGFSNAFGDALVTALSGENLTVFDGMNGNFVVDAGALVRSEPGPRVASVFSAAHVGPTALAADDGSGGGYSPGLGVTDNLATTLYGYHGGTTDSSVLSLAGDAAVSTRVIDGDRVDLAVFGYAGSLPGVDHVMAGFGIDGSLAALGGTLSFGVSQSLEEGSILGLVGNQAFDFGAGSAITAARLGFERAIGARFSVFGNVEIGVANALGIGANSLITAMGPVGFSGFNAGATVRDVFRGGDSITVSVSQPTRVAFGSIEIGLPTGRTSDGEILTESLSADLAPSGHQHDLGINYALGLGGAGQLRLAAQYSIDAGNVRGASGYSFAAGYGFGF